MTAAKLDILNAKMPAPDLLTCGQPLPVQLEQARKAGYRTIINLRPPGEVSGFDEAAAVAGLGMRYINIPIGGPADLTVENAQKLADVLDDLNAYPVLLHCGNSNRVGALMALKAGLLDGEDADTALEIGRQAGLAGLADAVRALLK